MPFSLFFTFSVERPSTWYQPNFGGGCQIFWVIIVIAIIDLNPCGIPAKVLVLKLLALYRYLRVLPRYLYQYQLINAGSDNLHRWMYPPPIKHSNWKSRRRAGVSGKFSYKCGVFPLSCLIWNGYIYIILYICIYIYMYLYSFQMIQIDPKWSQNPCCLGHFGHSPSLSELSWAEPWGRGPPSNAQFSNHGVSDQRRSTKWTLTSDLSSHVGISQKMSKVFKSHQTSSQEPAKTSIV